MEERLPQSIIDDWRMASARSKSQVDSPDNVVDGEKKIMALMSIPRLAWSDTFGCIYDVFLPLGIGVLRHSGVFWGQGLTRLMEECLERNVEYVITVDYDSVFTRRHILSLVSLMKGSDLDCVVPVQIRRESNNSMFTKRGADGSLLDKCPVSEFLQPLTEIVTGHFGLTIIRTSSLKKLRKPWFLPYPDLNGEWKRGHIDEDTYFWLNAEASKWKVCLANEVRIGHIQNVVTWPKSDFTPQFQYLSDWHEKGQPEWA